MLVCMYQCAGCLLLDHYGNILFSKSNSWETIRINANSWTFSKDICLYSDVWAAKSYSWIKFLDLNWIRLHSFVIDFGDLTVFTNHTFKYIFRKNISYSETPKIVKISVLIKVYICNSTLSIDIWWVLRSQRAKVIWWPDGDDVFMNNNNSSASRVTE